MIKGAAFFRLLLFVSLSNAVPLRPERDIQPRVGNSTAHSMECVSDDVVYQSGDEVPSPGPCEQCFCRPPEVVCTMIKCKVNSGCKTIQRANHCCPDYKCECEYNGRTYNNGERLERPDDPCQVCYCKGGEVMCTSITCYEREDCKPRFIPGQCCPKYDHCPLESRRFSGNSIRSVNATTYSSKREMQPWLLTKAEVQSTSSVGEVSSTEATRYPQTINIREILPTSGSVSALADNVHQAEDPTISSQDTEGPKLETEENSTLTEGYTEDLTTELGYTEGTSTEFLRGGVYEDSEETSTQNTSEGDYTSEEATTLGYETTSYGPNFVESVETSNNKESYETVRPDFVISEENSREEEDVSNEESKRYSSESSSSSSESSDLSMPPILQLSDQIQYLKLGGHHDEETTDPVQAPVIHVDIFNSKPTSCNESETVRHVIFAPADLRVVAEHLVKQKARPDKRNTLNKTEPQSVVTTIVLINGTYLVFNNTQDRDKWAAEILNQVVSNILLPLQNVEYVENITILNEETTPLTETTEMTTSFEETTSYEAEMVNTTSSEELEPSDGFTVPTTLVDTTTEGDSTEITSEEVSTVPLAEEPRKIPDMETLVKQFPSTLDERDLSILKDFLKKHISVP